jgi:tRNA-2-methylthio-N6-dimethylallyladenosine synthase
MEKVFIKTFGCQMNEYDSERMASIISEDAGFETAADEAGADVIILNTCSVRKHAEERAMSYIGRHIKNKKVIVAGCMAQSMKKELKQQFPKLHAIVGTFKFGEIGEIIRKGGIHTEEAKGVYSVDVRRGKKVRAFIAIMQGCDNFCSYCIVPFVRGREKSRTAVEIKKEITGLAKGGCKEITLLGQNVNSYNDNGMNFPALLRELVNVEGIERIRFMTSHPKDLTDELIDTVASHEKLCKHFHLPVQSGSDRVLELMNRKYTSAEYREKIYKIRKKIHDVSITTDVLAGFPGETEADFMETADLVRDLRFDDAYIFKYSVRPGTKAESMGDDVPEKEKLRRLNYILDLQKKISEDINNKLLGNVYKALCYGKSPKNKGEVLATTGNNKRIYINGGDGLIGTLFTVKLTEPRGGGTFTGEVVK